MYIFDFFKSLANKSKIPVIIYLLLNVQIVTMVVNWAMDPNSQEFNWISIPVAAGIYLFSIFIALSPVGEWILRLQTGCRKIKNPSQIEYLTPIFNEVYRRAKAANPAIPDNIELFMNNDKSQNAFATGRKTICITRGLYENASAEEMKGVLGHEFAHIAHHDTDLLLVILVGNFVITAIALLIRIIFRFLSLFGLLFNLFGSRGQGNLGIFLGVVGDLFVALFMWIWTKIGVVIVRASQRAQEYKADEFSLKLGYGESLCRFLDRLGNGRSIGIFSVLASTHPATHKRIERLQKAGANYNR